MGSAAAFDKGVALFDLNGSLGGSIGHVRAVIVLIESQAMLGVLLAGFTTLVPLA